MLWRLRVDLRSALPGDRELLVALVDADPNGRPRYDAVAVRRAAAFGLLKLGADAAPARGLIERLSADSHKGVNHYARQALAALEAQP